MSTTFNTLITQLPGKLRIIIVYRARGSHFLILNLVSIIHLHCFGFVSPRFVTNSRFSCKTKFLGKFVTHDLSHFRPMN